MPLLPQAPRAPPRGMLSIWKATVRTNGALTPLGRNAGVRAPQAPELHPKTLQFQPELLLFGRPEASDLGQWRPDALEALGAPEATAKGRASGRRCKASGRQKIFSDVGIVPAQYHTIGAPS
jgi:hypothetical protein